MIILTHIVYHSQLMYCLIQTQHQHQVLISFSVFEPYSARCSHRGFLSPSQHSHLSLRHHTLLTYSISVFEPYSARCSHRGFLSPSQHSHLTLRHHTLLTYSISVFQLYSTCCSLLHNIPISHSGTILC